MMHAEIGYAYFSAKLLSTGRICQKRNRVDTLNHAGRILASANEDSRVSIWQVWLHQP